MWALNSGCLPAILFDVVKKMMTKPLLLVLCHLSDEHQAQIAQHYTVLYRPTPHPKEQLAAAHPDVQLVLTTGIHGIAPEVIDAMPKLQLICTLGVGNENVAVDHARKRGIVLANGHGTNAEAVADHAMALLLAIVRNVVLLDREVRLGRWREELPMPMHFSGKRLGLVGMGDICQRVAKRAQAFDLQIAYYSRSPRPHLQYPYISDVLTLAQQSDYLIIAVPGGPDTRHLINDEVLQALGPEGYLVNVARGSVTDTHALANALQQGLIAGAALDVYESEPEPPKSLIGLDNVILTPHVGGSSPLAEQRTVDQFLANAKGHFSGQGPVSPF